MFVTKTEILFLKTKLKNFEIFEFFEKFKKINKTFWQLQLFHVQEDNGKSNQPEKFHSGASSSFFRQRLCISCVFPSICHTIRCF